MLQRLRPPLQETNISEMASKRPESLIAIGEISEVKIDHIRLSSLEKAESILFAGVEEPKWSLTEALKVLRDKHKTLIVRGVASRGRF